MRLHIRTWLPQVYFRDVGHYKGTTVGLARTLLRVSRAYVLWPAKRTLNHNGYPRLGGACSPPLERFVGFTYLVSDKLDVNVGHELGLIIVPVTVFLPGHTTPIQ
jgi:hypothetical protein